MATTPHKRLIFVDALRGLAALSVACYHFYGILSVPETPRWGRFAAAVFLQGDLGVYVFFALSGFVIAASLHRTRIGAGVVAKFALRRSLRLDPTYWTIIGASYLLLIAGALLFGWKSREPPGLVDVLPNMFYLDNLLGFRSVVPVGWTLCLEIQFYLVFVLLGWLACAISSSAFPSAWVRAALFLPLAAWSVLDFVGVLHVDQAGLFLPYWFMYFMGVVVWWALCNEISDKWAAAVLSLGIVLAGYTASREAATAAATAIALYAVGRAGQMDKLLRGPVLAYFGKISYSFYLVHALVGNNFLRVVLKVTDRTPESIGPWLAVALFLAAMTVSVIASHLLYRIIELPTHNLSRRVRWSEAVVPLDRLAHEDSYEEPALAAPALQTAATVCEAESMQVGASSRQSGST